MIKRLAQSFKKDESGTTAVEFGLVGMAFIVLLLGVIEAGRLFFTWNAFQYALENATRHALVNENNTESHIENFIAANMTSIQANPGNIQVNVAFVTLSDINFIEVDGTYIFRTAIPVLPESWREIRLAAQSRMPIP